VQEAPEALGFASEIISMIQERAILNLKAPIARVSGLNIPWPQFALEEHYMPDVIRISNAIHKTLEF
jgi:pyruvate dehydrogenase E1 component beta subunit